MERLEAWARSVAFRWRSAWLDALASAMAATLAWMLARWAFGHPQPIFASVAAVVCLAPGIPSRAGQAVNMLLGLVTGVVIGELLIAAMPGAHALVLIPVLVFVAMMAAVSFGLLPVIAIQGGVSALLVLALGPAAAGQARSLDALVGTAVALFFSQVLLTPDPERLIRNAAHRLLSDIGAGLQRLAEAARDADPVKAVAARRRLLSARESINLLEVRIGSARSILRWSVRGRLRMRAAAETTALYEPRAVILHASALVLADTLAANLESGRSPPEDVAGRVERLAQACLALGKGAAISLPAECKLATASEEWRPCLDSLHGLERLVASLAQNERRLRQGDSDDRAEAAP